MGISTIPSLLWSETNKKKGISDRGQIKGDNVEQLKKKTRELEVVAAMCKVNAEEVLEDIAVSVETTNKLTEPLHSQDETIARYLKCPIISGHSVLC